MVERKAGSVTRTFDQQQDYEFRKKEIQKTTDRLKVLEQLEKFREERMMKELSDFELMRKKEEEEIQRQREIELKRNRYLEKQREKLLEVREKKMQEDNLKKKE